MGEIKSVQLHIPSLHCFFHYEIFVLVCIFLTTFSYTFSVSFYKLLVEQAVAFLIRWTAETK